jgi:hypothetical protein
MNLIMQLFLPLFNLVWIELQLSYIKVIYDTAESGKVSLYANEVC